ncbi:MAG: inorganic phosphate transporter [Candidatus Polarisedimenticolia bacterium]|nr:inorganic phosphate transporter [bacterium]
MLSVPLLLLATIAVALVFDFTNGAHDCGNAIATVVSTKALSPRAAVVMATVLNLLGALIGTKVAETVGKGIVRVDPGPGGQVIVFAGLFGAVLWNCATWYWGLPSSSSHALIGGLIGAAIVGEGWGALHTGEILHKVVAPLFLSPLCGFAAGYLSMVGLAWMLRNATRRGTNDRLRHVQVGASALMATAHGLNDAQKTMGVIALALFIFGRSASVHVPFWVKLICAGAMAAGTMIGGWRIIRTMGQRIFKMQPVHGVAVAGTSTVVIFAASLYGAPISTTQTIASSVLGAGASRRLSAVRWGVGKDMALAWFFTLPCAGLVAAGCCVALRAMGLAG